MSTFVFKNLRRLFDKYAVARTEHDVKSTTKIIFFQILWPSQKPKLWLTFNKRSKNLNFKIKLFDWEKQILQRNKIALSIIHIVIIKIMLIYSKFLVIELYQTINSIPNFDIFFCIKRKYIPLYMILQDCPKVSH